MPNNLEAIASLTDEDNGNSSDITEPVDIDTIRGLGSVEKEGFVPFDAETVNVKLGNLLKVSTSKESNAKEALAEYKELEPHIRYHLTEISDIDSTISIISGLKNFLEFGIGTNELVATQIERLLDSCSSVLLKDLEARGPQYTYLLFSTYGLVSPHRIPNQAFKEFENIEDRLKGIILSEPLLVDSIGRRVTATRSFEDSTTYEMHSTFPNLYQLRYWFANPEELSTSLAPTFKRMHDLFPGFDSLITGYSLALDAKYYKLIYGDTLCGLVGEENVDRLLLSWVGNIGKKTTKASFYGPENVSKNIKLMQDLEETAQGAVKVLMEPPFNIRNFGRYDGHDLYMQYRQRDLPGYYILVVTPDDDHNGVFYGKNNFSELADSAKTANLYVRFAEVGKATGRRNSLSRLHSNLHAKYGEAKIVCGVLSGHGDVDIQKIQLGNSHVSSAIFGEEDYKISKRPQLIRSCYTPNAVIFVNSCGLGADKDDSFAKFVSGVTGLKTVGSSDSIIPLHLMVERTPEGGLKYRYSYNIDYDKPAGVNVYLNAEKL